MVIQLILYISMHNDLLFSSVFVAAETIFNKKEQNEDKTKTKFKSKCNWEIQKYLFMRRRDIIKISDS